MISSKPLVATEKGLAELESERLEWSKVQALFRALLEEGRRPLPTER